MPSSVPLTVLLPVPATLSGPRSPKEWPCFVWTEVEVEVRSLRSDARCVMDVPDHDPTPTYRHAPHPTVAGACADGVHWRGKKAWRYRGMPGLRPYALSTRYETRDSDDGVLHVDRTIRDERRFPTVVNDVDAGVVAASRAVAASLGITVATQAAAVRAHGEGGRGCTRDFMDRPFVPKRTSRVRIVDRAFLDLLVERVADGVAVVDGKPMVRCAPPEVVVTVDPHPYGHGDLARLSVSTSLAYADMTVVHGNAVAIPFPASLASEVRRTVRDAVGPNGAFEGFAFRDGAMAPREGSVVTDPPPRPVVPEEWFDKVEEVLSFRGVPLPDRSWPEHERRAAMTERVAEPRRTTVGWHATLSAAVAWCVETGPILRPAVGPTAPDVLDALTSPGSP